MGALGIDGEGNKHPLSLVEGATENAAVVQALIDNLIERGLDPRVCRLFIVDGAKALTKVRRSTFGRHTPIQRCQIHKARNVIERLPKPLHASVRKALRQAWELDDTDKAERLLRNLARRLEQEAPGVAASILEGLDEMLTVNRLGLPTQLRRSLACTNSIENMMGATCWRKSFRIVSRTLFPPSRYGPSSDKQPNIRTSHLLAPALECSDVRLVGQEARKRVLELRCPVTVPRAIGSLSRMNDDGANIIVSQQRRDLVFGNWAAAAIFVPRRVWIGDKLLHHLLRCYFRAVLGEHRPQSRQQLYSDAWLIRSAREVNRRPTCLLGPTTTSMLRNLQQQFPVGVQPIVKIWRLRRLQVLEYTDVVGSPPCELAPNC